MGITGVHHRVLTMWMRPVTMSVSVLAAMMAPPKSSTFLSFCSVCPAFEQKVQRKFKQKLVGKYFYNLFLVTHATHNDNRIFLPESQDVPSTRQKP